MKTINSPKTAIQEVLYELITHGSASIDEFFWMCGFRTRISNLKLKYGVKITSETAYKANKYGRVYAYQKHYLLSADELKAIEVYNKMQKEK